MNLSDHPENPAESVSADKSTQETTQLESVAADKNKRANVCASCKYQRKGCTPDCLMAPYFPTHRESDFNNVRQLFGVGRILKTLERLPPDHRQTAVDSIVYEAKLRAIDPVGGCLRVVHDLDMDIRYCTQQLDLVRAELALRKSLQIPYQDSTPGTDCSQIFRDQGLNLSSTAKGKEKADDYAREDH